MEPRYEYGAQLETERTPLENDGSGTLTPIRNWVFALPPNGERPLAKDFIAFHKTHILAELWRDELVPILNVEDWKLSYTTNANGQDVAVISVLTEAKAGSTILEKPHLIQDYATSRH